MFPYQWMFIFFGIFTVLFGISLWWLLPDSPINASFLSERERLIAVERLKSNRTGIKNSHHKPQQVKEAFCDPKIWILVFAVFCHNMTNSLQSNFTGIIIKGFGYTTYQAVLLSIPPGTVQAATMVIVALILATKWSERKRIFVIIFCYLPGIVACVILHGVPLKDPTKGAHLAAIFIIPMVAASATVIYSLLASNVAGYTKKTVSGSMLFTAYCVANIISPQTFLKSQEPYYSTGIAVTLAAFCINIVLFCFLYIIYSRSNKARDADPAGVQSDDTTQDLVDAFSDLTRGKIKNSGISCE